jgi:predicted RNA-binding Zn ribbon-like protein
MAETRPPPFFIGDDLALDFLNSVAAPWGQEIEWLSSGGYFLAWLEQAGAVPAKVASGFRARRQAQALDGVAAQARELREWLRAFVRDHAGTPLEPAALRDLVPLNRLLERDAAYRQIALFPTSEKAEKDGDRDRALRWQACRRWPNPKALLLPVAEAIGDLVCERDFTLVRKCEGPGCTLWFLDVSKCHARRWCSMAVCGNRAKAAAHRARQRSAQPA